MDNFTTSVEINDNADHIVTANNIDDNENKKTETNEHKYNKAKKPHFPPENVRFHRMLDAIWAIAAASGFRINSRIEAVDIKSGKEFK